MSTVPSVVQLTVGVVVVCLALGAAACRHDVRRAKSAREGDGPPASDDRRAPEPRWDGPPLTVDSLTMETYPVRWAAVVRATVPTGGFALFVDAAWVEDGRLHLLVTLEEPGPGDVVTQAFETVQAQYGTGTLRIDRVEVRARRVQRGDDPPLGGYALALRK